MIKVYCRPLLDNRKTFIYKGIKMTILYLGHDKISLFINDKFYKPHFRDSNIICSIHCSVFDKCGWGEPLCYRIYNLTNKTISNMIYFTEIKMTLFLSRIFISNIR